MIPATEYFWPATAGLDRRLELFYVICRGDLTEPKLDSGDGSTSIFECNGDLPIEVQAMKFFPSVYLGGHHRR